MKRTLVVLVCLLGFLTPAVTASAASITLTKGGAYYLGSINDSIPSSLSNEAGYINYLRTLSPGQGNTQIPVTTGEIYNREGSTLAGPFAPVLATDAVKKDDPSSLTIVLSTGYSYILAKYDQNRAGGLVWYGTFAAGDSITLPSTYNNKGLSHISLFNPSYTVPDGGATLLLLGGALAGLGVLRRRFGA